MPEQQPARFARLLAELEARLRLFPTDSHVEAASWSVLSHLRVQADLLVGLANQAGREDLLIFGRALSALVIAGSGEPQRIPPSWRKGFQLLAVFLDDLAAGLDAGDSLVSWLEDVRWQRLISWFENFQTPLLVMNELEEVFLQWQDAWCDETLDPGQERQLQERWDRLRQFGDALFHPASSETESSLLRWKGFGSES